MGRHLYRQGGGSDRTLGDPRLRICGGFDTEVGGDSLHGLLYLEQRFDALKRKYDSKLTPKKKSRGP